MLKQNFKSFKNVFKITKLKCIWNETSNSRKSNDCKITDNWPDETKNRIKSV